MSSRSSSRAECRPHRPGAVTSNLILATVPKVWMSLILPFGISSDVCVIEGLLCFKAYSQIAADLGATTRSINATPDQGGFLLTSSRMGKAVLPSGRTDPGLASEGQRD